MQSIWDQISPLMSDIIVKIIETLVVLVLSGFGYLQIKAKSHINMMKNKTEREILHKISDEAFAYIESLLKNESSIKKFNGAFIYVSNKLGDMGIKLSDEEIKAAIEKACLDYNAKKGNSIKSGNKAS